MFYYIKKVGEFYSVLGLFGLMKHLRCKILKKHILTQVQISSVKHPVYLRLGSSDILTCKQVLLDQEYAFGYKISPKLIVDAGANIGLTSVYFSNRFTDTKIIAIEPDIANYNLLKRNTESYENIVPIRAALWNKNTMISLVDPGLGSWGFQTQESDIDSINKKGEVEAITLSKIIEDHNIDHIDLLKVDIEGAEKEVFSQSEDWIGKVKTIVVELHDRFKPGCSDTVFNSTKEFKFKYSMGENIAFSREEFIPTK